MINTKLLLTTALMATALNLPNAYAACANNQTCGTNCCWDLTGGVLSISTDDKETPGTMTSTPWSSQASSITSVKIEGKKIGDNGPIEGTGITSIGNNAFKGAKSLQSITIPNSVTSIGDSAFGASALQSITIPDSVTSIGDSAFVGAKNLQSVTIPNSVTSIGDDAFRSAISLESITIPDSVTSIGNYAFASSGLQSITIPDSVTSIGNYAFKGAKSLQSITIGDSVTSIGNGAFSNSGLQSITIPDSVTSIGDYAFDHATSLESIIIGDGVKKIGKNAFRKMTGKVYCQETSTRDCFYLIGLNNTLADGQLQLFEKEKVDGVDLYSITDNQNNKMYYATADMMTNNVSCTPDECKALLNTPAGSQIAFKGKFYASLDDLAHKNHVKKRIYTIDEVQKLAGEKNRVSIRYR